MSNGKYSKYKYRVIGVTYILLVVLAFIVVIFMPKGEVEVEVSNYTFSEVELKVEGKSISLDVKILENITENRVRIEYPKNDKPYIVRAGNSVEIDCGRKARISIEMAPTTKLLEIHAENLSLATLLIGAELRVLVDTDVCICEIQALRGNYSLDIEADVAIVFINGNDIGLGGTINIDVGELLLNIITRLGGEIRYDLESGKAKFLLEGFKKEGDDSHGRIFAPGSGIDLDVSIDKGKASFLVSKRE